MLPVVNAFGDIVLPEALQSAEEANFSKLYYIEKLDVLGYYNLNDTYNTGLKQLNFKHSPEYAEKLDSLKGFKKEMAGKSFWVEAAKNKNLTYDLKRKGFEIYLGSNWGQGTAMARAPKSDGEFYFNNLPTNIKQEKELPLGVSNETLFLQMSESDGTTIEDNRDDVHVFLLFKVSGTKEISFKFFSLRFGWYPKVTQQLLSATNTRIILANTKTGEVYYQKQLVGNLKRI